MSKKKRLLRRILSTLMIVLMVSSWLIQPVAAQGTSDMTVNNTNDAQVSNSVQEAGNVSGKLTKGGSPLSGIILSVQSLSGDGTWYNASTTDANGNFSFSLPDGKYEITGAWVAAENKWYPYVQQFDVSGGVLVGSSSLNIDLPVSENETSVSGTITKGGQPLAGLTISFHSTQEPIQWFNTTTNEQGQFNLTFANGEYQIDGVWVQAEEKWYPLNNKVFSVPTTNQLNIDVLTESKFEVTGSLIRGTELVPNLTFSLRTTGDNVQWYNVTTNENGNYKLDLPVGEYIVEGIWLSSEQKWFQLDKVFTVEAAMNMDIKFDVTEPSAVTGKVIREGQPIVNTIFSIHTTEANPVWYNATTDGLGNFEFKGLPDGEYKLEGIWVDAEKKWYQLDKIFSISGGKLVGTTTLEINIQEEKNVTGTLTLDGQPVSDNWVTVRTTGTDVKYYNAKSDANGKFGLLLPDGEYTLEGIWVSSQEKWYQLNRSFNVVNGTLSGETELSIQLLSNNVTGTLNKGTDALSGVLVNVHTSSGEEVWYESKTDGNGVFKFNLPDGNYQIDGVWVSADSKWYPVASEFSVVSGVVTNPEALTINIAEKTANVSGSLVKGASPLSNIWVSAHSVGENEQWYNSKTDSNGAFEYTLPDGEYQIDGIWNQTEEIWYPLQLHFSVLNGQLVGATDLLIDLSEPVGNVNGSVMMGTTPVAGVWVSAHTTAGEEVWFDTKTDESGSFNFDLPDGAYQIEGIWLASEQKWYPKVTVFSVQNGVLVGSPELFINLQEPTVTNNVFGTLIKGTEPVSGVWISTHTVGGEEKWYSAQTDALGAYGFNLPDGDYRIEGVWVNSDQTWYPLGMSYSVVDGNIVGLDQLFIDLQQEPPSNVVGSLMNEGSPVGNAYVSIEDINNNYYYDAYTDANGNFTLNLPDGNYNVDYGFSLDVSNSDSIYFNRPFTVSNGELYENGALIDKLNLTVTPESLKLQLVQNGSLVNASEVFILQEDYSRGYYASNDGSGTFTLRLPDGSYIIDGYYDENEVYHNVGQSFEVIGGTTDLSPLVVEVGVPSVITGTVSNNNGPVSNIGFSVDNISTGEYYWVSADQTGNFSVELPDGNYIVSDAFDDVTYDHIVVDKLFSVVNGKLQVDGVPADQLAVYLPDETLSVQVVKDGMPVVGDVELESVVGGFNHYFYASTDENGYFSVRAADGLYHIYSISGYDFYYGVDTDIEVLNGTTSPNPYLIDLSTPQGNVQGVVTDSNGLVGNVELYFEKIGYGIWDRVLTNASGNFGLNATDGNYKVTEAWVDGKFVRMNTLFEVINGQVYVNGLQTDSLQITIPDKNLTGTVSDENGVIPYASVQVVDENGGYAGRFFVNADDLGRFSERFLDGSYSVISAEIDGNSIPLEIPFEIISGELFINGLQQPALDVSIPSITVPGKLVSETGSALPDVYFSVQKYDAIKNTTDWYSVRTDENGEFSLRYTEGEYSIPVIYIYGYDQPIFLNKLFTVTSDGGLVVDGQPQDILNLQVPNENFKGKLFENGNVLADASLYLQLNQTLNGSDFTYGQTVFTDSIGNFSARLVDGDYTIDSAYDEVHGYRNLNINFQVINGVPTIDVNSLDIGAVFGNVVGTVLDGNVPISNAELTITNLDGSGSPSDSFFSYTNIVGKFGLDLPDGHYKVSYIWSSKFNGPLSYEFTVVNGQVLVNGSPVNELVVTIAPVSVYGQIMNGDVPLSYTSFNILKTDSNQWFNGNTDQNGNFQLRLPDGNYEVRNLWVPGSGVLLDVVFSVIGGELFIDGVLAPTLNIALPSVSIQGQLVNEGTPINDAEVQLYKLVDGQEQASVSTRTDSNGNFSFRVPDGEYVIPGVHINGVYNRLQRHVTVVNGTTSPSPLVIDVNEVIGNVQGTLLDGDTPVANAYISVFDTQNPQNPQSYQAYTNADGNFGFDLPDGNYRISYISGDGISYSPDLEFVVQNGSLIVNGVPTENLILTIPSITVTGQLLDGTQLVSWSYINVREVNGGESYYTRTDSNGNFGLRLPDGDYIADYAEVDLNYVILKVQFSVVNGQLVVDGTTGGQLNLELPDVSVTGTVLDAAGQPYQNIDLYYRNNDGGYSYNSYRAKTDANGNFALRIPDGNYKVDYVYNGQGMDSVEQTEFSVVNGQLMINGSPSETLNVHALPVNVTGTLVDGDTPLPNTSISVINKDTNSWEGTSTNENGEFSFSLPDGEYLVDGIWGPITGSVRMNLEFSVIDGMLYVNGVQQTTLPLSLPPITLQGVIDDNGSPASYVNLHIEGANQQDFYYATTNELGEFDVRLPDGTYVITDIYYNDLSIPVYVEFSMVNGQLQINGAAQEQLVIELPTSTVSGQLMDLGAPAQDAYVAFTRFINGEQTNWFGTNTDENGNFNLRLPDGEYRAIDAGLADGTYVVIDKPFVVRDGKLLVGGTEETSLVVNTPETVFTGQLLDGDVPVPFAYLGVNGVDVEHRMDWEWVATDENGNFKFRLPDGSYYITWAWTENFDAILNTMITVENGVLYVEGTQSDTLQLDLPPVSFVGNVVKDGAPYQYAYLEMKDLKTNLYRWVSVDQNGHFEGRLPDGEYVIENIYGEYPGEFYSVNQIIIIENGTTNPFPYVIDITGL